MRAERFFQKIINFVKHHLDKKCNVDENIRNFLSLKFHIWNSRSDEVRGSNMNANIHLFKSDINTAMDAWVLNLNT